MSWTDTESVKKFLPGLMGGSTLIEDVSVRLDDTGAVRLPHSGIASGTEVVKRFPADSLVGPEEVTLTGETWETLSYPALVAGELVAASNWRLTSVFSEGLDFLVNRSEGKIRRIADGTIVSGATVHVWYQRYEVLTKGADYEIDYPTGTVSLATGSSLPPGSSLVVDYELNAISSVEALIPEAIAQAEDKIARRLKSDYTSSSTDQSLVTGATELSLSIICRSLSIMALGDGLPAAQSRAKAWLELASQFEKSAVQTLKPFISVSMPSRGGVMGNQSWLWN